jgi:hypothetical protein
MSQALIIEPNRICHIQFGQNKQIQESCVGQLNIGDWIISSKAEENITVK